ncbi:hypothetical protein [Streptomyces sp. SID12488]|uniref:hypothetical protein n=1 Tax=Streptomyces sp. SID12488 TaxID=2706040 RepID=UPI0013D943D8|nr:hypothetical protein [Streptomyces sp. SID12488]NEA63377.1 hypothetical protein [Streptomyces sp. SID12488]
MPRDVKPYPARDASRIKTVIDRFAGTTSPTAPGGERTALGPAGSNNHWSIRSLRTIEAILKIEPLAVGAP